MAGNALTQRASGSIETMNTPRGIMLSDRSTLPGVRVTLEAVEEVITRVYFQRISRC